VPKKKKKSVQLSKIKRKKLSKKDEDNRQRLIDLRETLGWTLRRLADEFYISSATVGFWETGERKLSGTALKLVEIYEKKLERFKE